MDSGLLAFVVTLVIAAGAVWLRLARVILRGEWPPIGLPVPQPGPSPGPTNPPSDRSGASQ